MKPSDNNQDHSEDREEFKKHTPIPESYQDKNGNKSDFVSGAAQKNVLAHQRSNLNPNQEQRPDSRNPERNRDK